MPKFDIESAAEQDQEDVMAKRKYQMDEKKIARFFLTYFATVTFHGLWNGASVGLAIYSVAQELGKSYPWAATLGVTALAILIVVFLAVLIVSNRKLNASNATESVVPEPSP